MQRGGCGSCAKDRTLDGEDCGLRQFRAQFDLGSVAADRHAWYFDVRAAALNLEPVFAWEKTPHLDLALGVRGALALEHALEDPVRVRAVEVRSLVGAEERGARARSGLAVVLVDADADQDSAFEPDVDRLRIPRRVLDLHVAQRSVGVVLRRGADDVDCRREPGDLEAPVRVGPRALGSAFGAVLAPHGDARAV